MGACIQVQQSAKRQEQEVHTHQRHREPQDIALRLRQRAARKVLLHHVLVKARHGNGNEHAAQKLLPEISGRGDVGEIESVAVVARGHLLQRGQRRTSDTIAQHPNRAKQSQQQATGEQGVGPQHRTHPTAARIAPDDGDHARCRDQERHAPRVEHEPLQHFHDQVKARGHAQAAAQQEKERTRAATGGTEALVQIAVDGHQLQAVIQRQQDERDNRITGHITQHHLQIAEALYSHQPGNTDERHATQRSADHAERNDIPA